jgi:hypothetical protein
VSDTVDISKEDRELVAHVRERDTLPLVLEQVDWPILGWAAGLIALFVAFLWFGTGQFGWYVAVGVVVYGLFLSVVMGYSLYNSTREVTEPVTLRADDRTLRLRRGDGDVDERYDLDDIELFQVSDSSDLRGSLADSALPAAERFELTLWTESDMVVVARGLQKDDAERTVEALRERLSTPTSSTD